ncbi:DNA mismatch repair protein [Pyrenophora tritici-repentis]|nr:DNA mismatch repair protein [Pyrenophora tritici-repentis]
MAPDTDAHPEHNGSGGAFNEPLVLDFATMQNGPDSNYKSAPLTPVTSSADPERRGSWLSDDEYSAPAPTIDFARRDIHIPSRTRRLSEEPTSPIKSIMAEMQQSRTRSSSYVSNATLSKLQSLHGAGNGPTAVRSSADSVISYESVAPSIVTQHLPPLQQKGGVLDDGDRLSPLLEDDPQSFDLVCAPMENHRQFSLEDRSEQLFSKQHLEAIFADTASLLRFSSFLSVARPKSVPTLIYYLDALKALRAISYANAVAEALEPIEGLDFTDTPARTTINTVLEEKASRAFDILVRDDLPAFITHVFIQVVSVSIAKRVTGNLPPMLREASEGLAEFSVLPTPQGLTIPSSSPLKKRKRLKDPISNKSSEKEHRQAFADWSRIKSGKPDFFNAVSKSKSPLANNSPDSQRNEADTCHRTKTDNFASFNIEPIDQGALNEHRDGSVASATTSSADNKENDDTIIWTDPCTKKTHLLNARTGCVMPDARARPDTDPTASIFGTHTRNKSVRLPSRPSTAVARKTPWLDNVLDTWENPVFKPTEKRIQQVNIHEDGLDPSHHPSRHGCSRFDIDRAFNQASTGGSSRLSKEGLKNAQVISQVDKKFILVKMQSFASEQEAKAGLLVLIDQHAADERVQVESLFRELCTPLPQARAYKSQLGHGVLVVSTMLEKPMQFAISSRERTHFTTHAARFAAWGILYDILVSAFSSSSLEKDKHVLSVTTLPPAISERCKADPKVLISFLRSTVWKYVEDAHLPLYPNTDILPIKTIGNHV